MISLEQIRSLETKVHKAVSLLTAAQEENRLLRSKLGTYENRIEELEFMIEEFKEDQSEIEKGIISALNHLDHLEDAVGGLKGQPQQSDIADSPESVETEEIEAHTGVTNNEAQPVAEEIAPNAWENSAQQFEPPAPGIVESYDNDLTNEEPVEQPARNQQLDIF